MARLLSAMAIVAALFAAGAAARDVSAKAYASDTCTGAPIISFMQPEGTCTAIPGTTGRYSLLSCNTGATGGSALVCSSATCAAGTCEPAVAFVNNDCLGEIPEAPSV